MTCILVFHALCLSHSLLTSWYQADLWCLAISSFAQDVRVETRRPLRGGSLRMHKTLLAMKILRQSLQFFLEIPVKLGMMMMLSMRCIITIIVGMKRARC